MPTNSFCVLPWYSQEIQPSWSGLKSSRPCCLLPVHFDLPEIKRQMLSGARPNDCAKCWRMEDLGQESRRQQENRFLDYKLDRDLDLIEQDCAAGTNVTLLYQVYLTSLCNQACVTCGSGPSTKWAELERQQGVALPPRHDIQAEHSGIDFARARRINVLGGEPLFAAETWRLLELLVKHSNTDCHVNLITNGSIKLSQQQEQLLQQFVNLHLCVSIDGIESRFEYMRWPGRWPDLLRNLDQYRSIVGDRLVVSYTISSVNAIYYDETVSWFRSQDLMYNHNLVYHPSWASLPRAPWEIKQHLGDHEFFRDVWDQAQHDVSGAAMFEQLMLQDHMKRTDLRTSMPQLWRLLKSYDTDAPISRDRAKFLIEENRWTRVDDAPAVS